MVDYPFPVETRDLWHGDPARGDIEPLGLGRAVKNVFTSNNTYSYPYQTPVECRAVLRNIQGRHQLEDRLPDIRYNFVIACTGQVFECRGWDKRPDLPHRLAYYNMDGIYIAFLGPGHPAYITDDMRTKLEALIVVGVKHGYINYKCNKFTMARFEEPIESQFTSVLQ